MYVRLPMVRLEDVSSVALSSLPVELTGLPATLPGGLFWARGRELPLPPAVLVLACLPLVVLLLAAGEVSPCVLSPP